MLMPRLCLHGYWNALQSFRERPTDGGCAQGQIAISLTGGAQMSSPAYSTTGANAEEPHRLSRRGLWPALDAVFPLLLAITDDDRAASAIGVTRELARAHGAIPTVLRALGSDHDVEVPIQPF